MSAPEPYQPEGVICLSGDVPTEGWEMRQSTKEDWLRPTNWPGNIIVEARPIPKPPLMVEIPRDVAEAAARFDPVVPEAVSLITAIRAALAAEADS